jgi:hypothetical protein
VQGGSGETSTDASVVPLASLSPPPQPSGSAFLNSYTKSYAAPSGLSSTLQKFSGMHLTMVSLASYPEAVCNDGSPAAYYFSPGDVGQPWIIYLEGGFWCWSQASCDARFSATPFEMSSKGNKLTMSLGGVFSTSRFNPWAHANKVVLSYCSSDAWAGNASASAETFGYAFKGVAIVEAAIADLVANQGLGPGSDVLFGGCSAGGRGALMNLDYVAPLLPPESTVRGLIDSALWLDLQPPDAAETSLQVQTQSIYALINPGSRIPPACAAAYPGAEWKCLFGVYRLPFVITPFFLQASQARPVAAVLPRGQS